MLVVFAAVVPQVKNCMHLHLCTSYFYVKNSKKMNTNPDQTDITTYADLHMIEAEVLLSYAVPQRTDPVVLQLHLSISQQIGWIG